MTTSPFVTFLRLPPFFFLLSFSKWTLVTICTINRHNLREAAADPSLRSVTDSRGEAGIRFRFPRNPSGALKIYAFGSPCRSHLIISLRFDLAPWKRCVEISLIEVFASTLESRQNCGFQSEIRVAPAKIDFFLLFHVLDIPWCPHVFISRRRPLRSKDVFLSLSVHHPPTLFLRIFVRVSFL